MIELVTALALVLVIEGALYALFPEAMRRMMARALELPPAALRYGGLTLAAVGVVVVWLIKG